MYTPLGFRCCALLPRLCTCRCQTLLRISWWVKKCLAVFHPTPVHQTRCWLPHWCRRANPSIHPYCINPYLYLQSSPQIVFSEDTYLTFTVPLCLRELPSHLTDRWFSFEVAPSYSLMWRPENEPPPQDPIKAKPRVCRFDIHRLGNLCHQHILCHVRMITAY